MFYQQTLFLLFSHHTANRVNNNTHKHNVMKSPQHKNKTPKSRSDPQQQQKSNSLAVTVFRNAPDYYSCDPLIPLSTCLPASGTCAARMRLLPHADQGLSLRRSPRFNSAPAAVDGGNAGSRKRKRSPETAATAAEEETSRRRSPRFSTPVKWQGSRGPELPLNAYLKDQNVDSNLHSDAKPIKNSHGKFFGEKHLRQCPGLDPSCEAYAEKLEVKLHGTLEPRRSPRLSSSNGNENMEINASQVKRTSKVVHQKKKNTKVISTYIELSNSPVEQHMCGIDDTKYLIRSSEAITSPSWTENGRTTSNSFALPESDDRPPRKKFNTSTSSTKECIDSENFPSFIGDPIPDDEAQKRWGWRYELKDKKCKDNMFKINEGEEDEIIANVKCHYAQAEIGNCIFSLGDCAFVKLMDRSCPFCARVEEEAGHMFFHCNKVIPIWWKTYSWVNNSTALPNDPRQHFLHHGSILNEGTRADRWKCWWLAVTWTIWQQRNKMIFSNESFDSNKCVWILFRIYASIGSEPSNLKKPLILSSSNDGEGEEKHVGKIIEFFQTTDGQNYFRVQWFYRIQDTVVQDEGGFHDKRRVFYSAIMNDNLIDCIMGKANVTHITPRVGLKLASISSSDFYYDMEYCVDYSTFRNIPTDASTVTESQPCSELNKTELALLDLYSGCGGMSTGLCLGAKTASVNLVTRWAVDSDRSAGESLKLNHSDTHVRNESAEDFLELLKAWEKLCKRYNVSSTERKLPFRSNSSGAKKRGNSEVHDISDGELEVSKLVDICFGDPNETGKRGLYLKVHWKGYSASEDTWEPIKSLSKCKESMQDFVRKGMKSNILPLPGEVDVICGGPPCQGISGYNRFRNCASPLDDERNRQIVIFMDMVKFLKPRYVLMENVVDILRFDKGSLGRYALSRLVHMNYQARLGIIAAGCYGLPQFRLRVFLWGAHPSEVIPQFPLPTHDVIVRYWPPPEFERNVVAYDEEQPRELEKATVIQDAISDLPAVMNTETRDEMPYQNPPETEFQRYIRSTKYEMTGSKSNATTEKRPLLYDHRPYFLFEDDYLRVCQIPKRKGANFRDLPGVIVGADNVVRRHPTENPLLPSGKPLVPEYCFTFEHGKSKRPFARLWWDENLPTALTFPSCHNQVVLHPEQDRVLTIREFARLQGFPDYYRFYGTVKERYCQIGNAVAVPVSRALGYALGLACRKLNGNEPLVTLPSKFSHSNYLQLSKCVFGNTSNEVNSRQFRALDAEATPGSIGQDSRVEDSTQLQTCYNNQPGNTD
ncbi:DNA (cytosine-5)-methyltransferase CMT2 [Glycine soja]